MENRAPFIVFEGPEGAGKSFQATQLSTWLREAGFTVVQTREPGGTATGDAIRSILLQSDHLELRPETEALLMSAARAQHVREVIAPALEAGCAVICDRYVDSTYAYQGGGLGLPYTVLEQIQAFATGGLLPDLRILLDVPVEVGLARRHGDTDQVNRIDRAPLDFHRRVQSAFLALAQSHPYDWAVIDASAEKAEVFGLICDVVSRRFNIAAVRST